MVLAEERLRPLDIPCYVSPGNDDDQEVADVIDRADWVTNPEGDVVDIRGHEMISWGWSNPTPWDTPREQSEDELGAGVDAMASRLRDPGSAIFNLHCPPLPLRPRRSGAERHHEADHGGGQIQLAPMRSTAVRRRSALSAHARLHGHVHDCRAMKKIERSIFINPGATTRPRRSVARSSGSHRTWSPHGPSPPDSHCSSRHSPNQMAASSIPGSVPTPTAPTRHGPDGIAATLTRSPQGHNASSRGPQLQRERLRVTGGVAFQLRVSGRVVLPDRSQTTSTSCPRPGASGDRLC